MQWFAMRATYGQELKSQKELKDLSVDSYVPMVNKVVTRKGHKEKILVPAMNNYIFVKCTANELSEAKRAIPYLRYVMDHGGNKVVVPSDQMENFMRVSSVNDNSAIYLSPEEINLKGFPRIRIHGGVFDGVEGRYVKIEGKRNRRLYVDVENLVGLTVVVNPDLIEVLE